MRPGVTLNPRCDVHGPAEEVAVAGDDVARVDPRASGRHSRFVGQKRFALEGAEEAHELLRKNAIVGRAGLLLEG